MQIDYRTDPAHAVGHSVFDRATGQKLDDVHSIVFADDQVGRLKVYRRVPTAAIAANGRRQVWSFATDQAGNPILDDLYQPIDIVPKR